MDTAKESQQQNTSGNTTQEKTEQSQVIHPFGSDKEIKQEDVEKEQQYKEALTERD